MTRPPPAQHARNTGRPWPSKGQALKSHDVVNLNFARFRGAVLGCLGGFCEYTQSTTLGLSLSSERGCAASNCLFRLNGAAIVLSSRRRDARRAKYALAHAERTLLTDDVAFGCIQVCAAGGSLNLCSLSSPFYLFLPSPFFSKPLPFPFSALISTPLPSVLPFSLRLNVSLSSPLRSSRVEQRTAMHSWFPATGTSAASLGEL